MRNKDAQKLKLILRSLFDYNVRPVKPDYSKSK